MSAAELPAGPGARDGAGPWRGVGDHEPRERPLSAPGAAVPRARGPPHTCTALSRRRAGGVRSAKRGLAGFCSVSFLCLEATKAVPSKFTLLTGICYQISFVYFVDSKVISWASVYKVVSEVTKS